MGFWSRLLRRKSDSMSIDDWWDRFGPSNVTAGNIHVNQLTAMQVSAVLGCVSILSEDVAKLPVHVYRRKGDGGRAIVTDHPLERLMARPNGWQTRFEFIEQMQAALRLRGNAYACIVRDGRGRPTSLVPVNPDRVWIYEAPDGSLFYQVARRGPHDIAVLSSLPLMVPQEDMFHLRWLSFENSLWGASRISVAREVIGLALSQQELAGRLSGNNTNLGGVLQTDKKLTKDVADRLKQSWKDNYGGLRNAGGTAVLEEGLKWQPLGMTATDAEFIASRNLQVAEIARLFRVPPHKIGVMERMVGTSLEQLDQDYANNTISSYLGRWEAKLSDTFGLSDDNLFVEFDLSGFLRGSILTRYNAYRIGVMSGVITPNQASRAEGLPDDPNGDVRLQPANMVPLGSITSAKDAGPGSDTTGAPADGGDGDPASSPDAASES